MSTFTASTDHPSHPEVGTLIAYHDHRLDADAAGPVRQHLAGCRSCTALLLDLESFSAAGGSAAVPPQEIAEARLLARSVFDRASAERWRNAALASFLVLAIALPIALYFGTQAVRSRGGRGLSPEINLAIVSLTPLSSRRGAGGARLSLGPDSRFFTLVLTTADVRFSEYSLVILERAGRKVLSLEGLVPSTLGTFNVGLPAHRFRPGRYRLELFGLAGERREPVEEYDLEIVSR